MIRKIKLHLEHAFFTLIIGAPFLLVILYAYSYSVLNIFHCHNVCLNFITMKPNMTLFSNNNALLSAFTSKKTNSAE